MLGIKAEFLPSVLQGNAAVGQHHAGAETVVIALDERDHIALPVRRGQVHRTTGVWIARLRRLRLFANLRTAAGAIAVTQQIGHGHAHVQRIGDVVQAIAVGQLHRFQLAVPGLLAVTVVEVEAFKNFQRHQRHQPLPARRDFPDIHAAIIDVDGLDPLRAVMLKIRGAQIAARCPRMPIQAICQIAAIQTLATREGQFLEGSRLRRVTENLSGPGRATVNQERVEPGLQPFIAMGTELIQRDLPLMGNHRRQRKTVSGQTDRRLQQIGERQHTKTLRQLGPGRWATGHRLGRPAIQRHLLMAGRLHRFDAQTGRGMAVGIEAMQLVFEPDQRKRIAAQATTRRLDHGQRRRRGDGRVNRVTALLQHLDTGLRGQRLGRRNHATTGEDALALRRIRVFVSRKFQHGKGSSNQQFIGRT